MKLLGNTRELKIVMDEWKERQDKETGKVTYPLYEANYISGIREIFKEAIKQKSWIEKNKERFFLDEKRNILTFIGKRGAGKTTAMDEFCQILSRLERNDERKWWLTQTLEKNEQDLLWEKSFKFHVLSPIDASLLGEKENLFELIMANIYQGFESKWHQDSRYGFEYNSKMQECMSLFVEVFKLYRSINSHKDEEEYGNFIVSKMQFLSSQRLQECVVKLIDILLTDGASRTSYEYIVIPIDDLDLNLVHGYEMLEQIQKYFSYYKILVLIAMDYEQMWCVCQEHFCREMPYTKGGMGEKGIAHSAELVNDYMTKLFHFSQRMYMPNMQQLNKKSQIVVNDNFKDTDIIFEKRIQVKEFVMCKIAENMRIFYDGCGNQNHFSEPKTIRDLVSYNEFIESMNIIEYEKLMSIDNLLKLKNKKVLEEKIEGNRKILKLYDQNHERFNQDINIRMAQGMLLPFQKRAFDWLNMQTLERRARFFTNAYRKENKIILGSILDEQYSYGQLLGKIYSWGRNKDNSGNYIEDKPFIRCVLASFTSELVREYLNYRYKLNENKQVDNKYKMRLLGVLGNSFGNAWTGEAFPAVTILVNNFPKEQRYGYRRELEARTLSIDINWEELRELRSKEIKYKYELRDLNEIKKGVKKWILNEEIIETLEIVSMFFVRREGNLYKGLAYEIKFELPTEKKTITTDTEKTFHGLLEPKRIEDIWGADIQENIQKKFFVRGCGEKIDLDMMAFVAKPMNYEEERERLHVNVTEELTKAIGDCLECLEYENIMKTIKKAVEEVVKEKSMFTQLKNMEYGYEVAFPFYNLDMSYNVLKRIRKEYFNKRILEKNLFEEICGFYTRVAGQLEKEAEFYQEVGIFQYLKVYKECPYITAIEKIAANKKSKVPERVKKAFNSITIDYLPDDISNDRSITR